MKLVKKLAALLAATTALAFSSCNNLGLDENSFQNKVNSYFLEMTSTAAVSLFEIAPNDMVKNRAGVDCVPASGEHVVSFYLRNPQKYRFTLYDNMHFSVGGVIMEEGSGVSIAQDPNDTAKINITYSQEYLLEHPLGEDISPSVELFHPVSHASFGVFNKMNISSDSPPPSVQLACFQRKSNGGATEDDNYVVCFFLPKIKSFANSYDSSGNTDVHIFYINGTKKYLNINDNKIYNTATVTDGVWSFDDEDTSISGSEPDHLGALNPTDPEPFVFDGHAEDYRDAYVPKYMTLPETIGYYGDSEVTYNFTLEDDAGLSAGMTTSNKATRLTPPILLNAEDGAEIESGTDATHCRSYAADEESMYFTLRIVHNGKDAEDRPCGSVKINYTITEINGEPVFGGNDTLIGTANGSATLKLPKGKYDIQATASKDYYITSLKKEAKFVQVTKPAVYYVSQTGDNGNPGSKALPYKTVQWAVGEFKQGIHDNEYPADGICTIYVMSDLYPEAETDFTADGSDPENKSLIAIGGSGWAATVNIIGYGGMRTIDAKGIDFDDSISAPVHRVMRVDGGHLVLENINLAGGYATKENLSKGMGTGLLALNNGTTVKYTGGSVYNNDTYTARGAGIYISNAKVEMQDVTIRDNGKRLENQGGNGLCAEDAADVTMTNCNVIDNGVSEIMSGGFSHYGGGIYFNGVGAKLYIKGGSIKGNKLRVSGNAGVPSPTNASYGGGIWMYYGDLILEGVTITGNESYNGGAGIYQKIYDNDTGTLTIKGGAGGVKTTIYDNYTAGTTTQSNLYITLTSTTPVGLKTITIDGNIGASKIGVNVPFTDTFKPAAGAPMVFTNGYNYPTTNKKKPGEVFFAENTYGIAFGSGPYEKEAAFAVSSASSYNATDYTFTPTLRNDCAPSVYPGATKTFVINDLIGKRKVAGSSPVSYDSMCLDRSNLTLYKMNESTPVYDPTGKTVSISAALYSGGTKVRDATRDASDARKFTLVAKTAGDAAILPPNNYTLKIVVEFLGATHEANIPIAIDYSAETVADYINKGLTTSGLYSVKVTGTVGPGMDEDPNASTGDEGLAKVAKAIYWKQGSGVTIDLDATGTSCVYDTAAENPLHNYNHPYFKNCTALHSFKMPDWMLGVLPSLFENCGGLTSVEIPDSVVSVGASAFSECRNLDSITFAGTSTEWKKIEFGTNWRYNVKTNEVHCAGDNTDVPFGFFEVTYIRGGSAAEDSSCTSLVSGSGTSADPYVVEGDMTKIFYDVDTDDGMFVDSSSVPSGVTATVTEYGTHRLVFDRSAMGDLPDSGYWSKTIQHSGSHNVYFKIMPVTTAAVPEGFVTVEGSTVVGETKFNDNYASTGVFVEGRSVTISTFWICDHEVTQKEYETYCKYGGTAPDDVYGKGDNYPAHCVSWYDAIVYCNLRSKKEGLTPCYKLKIGGSYKNFPGEWTDIVSDGGKYCGPSDDNSDWNGIEFDASANGYRLPTEVEWEYAARGGKAGCEATYPTDWAGTDLSTELGKYAWYEANSDSKTHEVKTEKQADVNSANGLGIYDMSGNVKEWCWDFSNSIDSSTAWTGPVGASSDSYRVSRGGGWSDGAIDCSVAHRSRLLPFSRGPTLGFRVVRTAPNP